MAEFDHGVKLIMDTTGRELARVAGVACQRLTPIESTLPRTTELLADRAFRASYGRDRFVLYFEFYTRWQRNAPWDMLAKSGLMALYPLCDHAKAPRDAIRHSAEVIEAGVHEPAARADKLILLDTFGGLAYPRLDVAEVIGRAIMMGSRFIREERLSERLEQQRIYLLKLASSRFGAEASAEAAPAVHALYDPQKLDRLYDELLAGVSLHDFRAALAATNK